MNHAAEFEKFVQDVQKLRSKSKTKKIIYPEKIRKRAVSLIGAGCDANRMAAQSGISKASLDVWCKKYSTQIPTEADIIPLKAVQADGLASQGQGSKLSLQVICINVQIDQSELARTLEGGLWRCEMITAGQGTKVFMCKKPVDFRYGYDANTRSEVHSKTGEILSSGQRIEEIFARAECSASLQHG